MCKDSISYNDIINDECKQNVGEYENFTPARAHVGKLNKKSEDKLEAVFRQLDEIKTTLDTLVEKRNEDKVKIKKSIRLNVEELVWPYLERLKNCNLNHNQKLIVGCMETSLKSITSSFFENLGVKLSKLTPMEIKVADLVKSGKTNKEIADLLCLSINTILSHRSKLREKLGLKNKKINLRAYLLSVAE
jgi:DNA-binding CsgD family transcriptional regulator